ncbi:hypothetical protein MED193_00275 [Roseobacter sp. MED193]|nr:hypothetical protein MED193_00275 [Roseobacter sp. MED193]
MGVVAQTHARLLGHGRACILGTSNETEPTQSNFGDRMANQEKSQELRMGICK